ncbi:MAG: arsenite methyltransferase [Chloroflexota bacterium]|nr:MAG: arsenite methyltransferase [Chloroflexota bacterium]
MLQTDGPTIHEVVRERYGVAARDASSGAHPSCGGSCCSSSADSCRSSDGITTNLYGAAETSTLPDAAVRASLGCGNPTALIDLRPGDRVLDLGSGGGIDVLLSARRVGPTGHAYGVDMTPDMLALARRNAAEAGVANVTFLEGTIEALPFPDAAIDVVISNCVVNLSPDKPRVLREAFRVLAPGGRVAISDVVAEAPLPFPVRKSLALWAGCIAGALTREEYTRFLSAAGFVDIEIESTRVHDLAGFDDPDLRSWLARQDPDRQASLKTAVFSAFVRARKPA